mmetsp:Transcript_146199/g.379876  ORF Transcript_146199/g.379876 Transcript_146199/m.379876 type:complete len:143 (+) Transcript_146199:1586-2014(+)
MQHICQDAIAAMMLLPARMSIFHMRGRLPQNNLQSPSLCPKQRLGASVVPTSARPSKPNKTASATLPPCPYASNTNVSLAYETDKVIKCNPMNIAPNRKALIGVEKSAYAHPTAEKDQYKNSKLVSMAALDLSLRKHSNAKK